MDVRGDRGVSPVIGVVLLVAVVVVLSASAGVVVLGLGEPPAEPPQTSLETEVTPEGTELVIVGGDEIQSNRLEVKRVGETIVDGDDIDEEVLDVGDVLGPFDAPDNEPVQVVWQAPDDGDSYTLYEVTPSDSVTLLANKRTVVYNDLEFLKRNGTETEELGNETVDVYGPSNSDIDGDGNTELPYVNSTGHLRIIDSNGNTETLVPSGASKNADNSQSRMAVGKWNGSSTSVFYASGSKLYRVADGGSPVKVASPGDGVDAVSGTADIDGDGSDELVFADASQQARYLEPNGTVVNVNGGGAGQNNGIGLGGLHDFDGNGAASLAIVDGSNNVKLASNGESNEVFTSTNAKKTPPAVSDIDVDGEKEIVYVGKSSGKIKYVNNVDGVNTIEFATDSNGDRISASDVAGLAS